MTRSATIGRPDSLIGIRVCGTNRCHPDVPHSAAISAPITDVRTAVLVHATPLLALQRGLKGSRPPQFESRQAQAMTPYPGGGTWKMFSTLSSKFGLSMVKGCCTRVTFGCGEEVSTRT